MNIEPFGKNILVIPTKKEQVLVSETNSITAYGEVVGIGKDVKTIKVGDTIGFTKWGIRELDIQDDKHYFVPEDSDFLLGVIR